MIFTDLPYGTTKCKWDILIMLEDFIEIDNKKLTKEEYLMDAYKKGISYQEAFFYFESKKKDGLWSIMESISPYH